LTATNGQIDRTPNPKGNTNTMTNTPHPAQGANRPVRRSPEGKTLRARIVELETSNESKSGVLAGLLQDIAALEARLELLEES
jgi:hypothetical protein